MQLPDSSSSSSSSSSSGSNRPSSLTNETLNSDSTVNVRNATPDCDVTLGVIPVSLDFVNESTDRPSSQKYETLNCDSTVTVTNATPDFDVKLDVIPVYLDLVHESTDRPSLAVMNCHEVQSEDRPISRPTSNPVIETSLNKTMTRPISRPTIKPVSIMNLNETMTSYAPEETYDVINDYDYIQADEYEHIHVGDQSRVNKEEQCGTDNLIVRPLPLIPLAIYESLNVELSESAAPKKKTSRRKCVIIAGTIFALIVLVPVLVVIIPVVVSPVVLKTKNDEMNHTAGKIVIYIILHFYTLAE